MGIFNHMNTNPNINTTILHNKPFFITAYYKKSKDPARLFMNEVSTYQIIPYDCRLTEISCYFYGTQTDYSITLKIKSLGSKTVNQSLNSSKNVRRQNFPLDIQLAKMIFCGLKYINKVLIHQYRKMRVFSALFFPFENI